MLVGLGLIVEETRFDGDTDVAGNLLEHVSPAAPR